MAFLTNLDRRLSEIGQGALKKTKDVSDTVKISSAIKDEENKQMDIFRQIGSYYYRTYAGQADGQMKAWCDSISASQALVKQYQDQLTILKGVAFCPNCNAEVPLTSAFCSNCGSKMVVKPPVVQMNTGKTCPACGAFLSEGQMFCTNCGSRVPETSAGAAVQEVKQDAGETAGYDAIEKTSDAGVLEAEPVQQTARCCPNCGKELGEGQMFCTNCGTKL